MCNHSKKSELLYYQKQFTIFIAAMAQHDELGKKGEQLAVKHLRKKGYTIKEVNWRFGKGEIDIIAKKDGMLVFVEVKTRQSDYFGDPEFFVTKKKQKQVIKIANAYIEQKDIDSESRFDVISIILNKKEQRLEHIEDAFYPLA